MSKTVLILLALAALAPAAFCAPEGAAWGTRVSESYDLWGWISAYTDEDRDSWDALTPAERDALLKKAAGACSRADERAGAAGTDGEAILRLSGTDLEYLGACSAAGAGRADDLRDKQRHLARIKSRAAEGRFDQADMDWLSASGLTLRLDQKKNDSLQADQAARAQKQKKTGDDVKKKYSALDKKDLTGAELGKAYDGGSGRGAGDESAVKLSAAKTAAAPKPEARGQLQRKTVASTPPPAVELTDKFKGMKSYSDMNKENTYNKVMNEVDKDGVDAAAKNQKIKSAGYATLKSVYAVSKDFDETFVNNPSPKKEDVSKVIASIKAKAKNPQEAWEIAYQMRNQRDFPALRDAEHYLWACSEASESRWKATQTLITTPMYSAAKLPGLRKIFFDDTTSPPSVSEIKWGWKGVTDCVK